MEESHQRLSGKVALITGAAGGLAKQTAIRYAEEGAKLALCDINAPGLAETVKLCEQRGAVVLAQSCDIAQSSQLETLVSSTVAKFKTVDILVNSAIAIKPPHSFIDHDIATLELAWSTGLVPTWHLMKLCYPYLKSKGGKIINFGSAAGYSGLEGYAAYAATKEAIRGLSRVVAREWGKDNINVNVINPGALTDTVQAYIQTLPVEHQDPQFLGFKLGAIQRYGDPYSDITPVMVFLASDDSRHITGQTFMVDGGAVINA